MDLMGHEQFIYDEKGEVLEEIFAEALKNEQESVKEESVEKNKDESNGIA